MSRRKSNHLNANGKPKISETSVFRNRRKKTPQEKLEAKRQRKAEAKQWGLSRAERKKGGRR